MSEDIFILSGMVSLIFTDVYAAYMCVYTYTSTYLSSQRERVKVDKTPSSQLRNLEKDYFSRVTVVSIVSILLSWVC